LSAKAYDAAGNIGQSTSVTVTVFNDTVVPTVSVNPVSTPSVATSQTISGSVSDNDAVANVTVQVGSGSLATAAVSGNSWSITLSGLVVGSNLITVRATDRAGNSSTATASITVLAPSVATPDPLTIADAQLALQMVSLDSTPTAAQLTRLDVAPYIDGKSSPNGVIDSGDVMVILLKLVGKL
jgi:chitinase